MSNGKLFTTIEWVGPPIVALSLLATLFAVPRPAVTSWHPWKIELLVTFILLGLTGLILKRVPTEGLRSLARNRFILGIFVFFGIFLLWSLGSAGWAVSPYSALQHTFVWISFILCLFIAIVYLDRSRSISTVTGTFIWITIVLGALCLLDYITLPDFKNLEGTLRIRYGKYAELLAAILPIIWMAAVYTRRTKGYLLTTCVGAASWLVVMLSLSKGAFIAGIAGVVIMAVGCLLFSFKTFRIRILTSFGIWLALTIVVQASFSLFSTAPATTDYITGAADTTRETSMFRVFTWKVGRQMFQDNWLTGVGADNFGVSFNAARRSFRENYPKDAAGEYGEDYMVERAHNEPLQIAGELGLIGITLFAAPFLLIAIWTFRTFRNNRYRLSPMLWACLGGMSSFAISSSVSSFSFRAVQNGIAFFMVLAIAVHELKKSEKRPSTSGPVPTRPVALRWAVSVVFLVLLFQTAFFSTRGAAEYLAITASTTSDREEAINMYDLAFKLDPDYPALMMSSAWRSELSGDSHAAAQKMRRAIDNGLGVPTTYSTLAKYQLNAGLPVEAEHTLTEAISIFPRSVFLRTRLGILLQNSGKFSDAEVQLNAAADIDSRQAAGWHSLIRKGSLAAFLEAQEHKNIAHPADLVPLSVVREFLDDQVEVSRR